MATKRMFDKAIIDTDRFMDLSLTSKALYFLLGMEADDEGFVSYKKVMRIHGGNEDDMKVLLAKNFLIGFPSGVVVVTDWNSNNWLDSRRIKPTEYQNERKLLALTPEHKYVLSNGLASIEESSIEESSSEAPLRTVTYKEGDEEPMRIRGDTKKVYEHFVRWAEEQRGFPFLRASRLKQYSALKIAKDNKIKAEKLKERWEEMAADKFWMEKGFDWMNVVLSFDKKQ